MQNFPNLTRTFYFTSKRVSRPCMSSVGMGWGPSLWNLRWTQRYQMAVPLLQAPCNQNLLGGLIRFSTWQKEGIIFTLHTVPFFTLFSIPWFFSPWLDETSHPSCDTGRERSQSLFVHEPSAPPISVDLFLFMEKGINCLLSHQIP